MEVSLWRDQCLVIMVIMIGVILKYSNCHPERSEGSAFPLLDWKQILHYVQDDSCMFRMIIAMLRIINTMLTITALHTDIKTRKFSGFLDNNSNC